MKEALEIINTNKIYKNIFKEIRNKYKIYERFTGSFTINANSEDEVYVLSNFDSNVFYTNKAKINVAKVVNLFEAKLKENTFKELLEYVLRAEIISNKQKKNLKIDEENEFYSDILKNCNGMLGAVWIQESIAQKQYGYSLLCKHYKIYRDNKDLDYYKNLLITIIQAIENLPYKENQYENLAIFSAKNTKNPHFFDKNTLAGNLLIYAISYILKENYPKKVDELNETYYKVGLLKDEISNNTTIYGFAGYKEGEKVSAIAEYKEWKEPLQISISNLLKVDSLICENNKVFIFENPSVFNQIRLNIENITAICTSGQLNLSSYMILDKIRNADEIYYAGDFDPEGIDIANRLRKRYGNKIRFMLYKKEIYDRIKSKESIEDKRLNIIKNIDCVDLNEVIQALLKDKKAGYQELLIDKYHKFIINSIINN